MGIGSVAYGWKVPASKGERVALQFTTDLFFVFSLRLARAFEDGPVGSRQLAEAVGDHVGQAQVVIEVGRLQQRDLRVAPPCGSQKGFHPEGELATARAAQAAGHLQVLSTVTSTAVEEVNEARGEPVWYQLYATSNWSVTEAVVERVPRPGAGRHHQ